MWSNKIDFLTTWKYYLGYLCLLLFVSLSKSASISTAGWTHDLPFVHNKAYFYLQFIACIFVVTIAERMFAESFRLSTIEYLKAFKISNFQIIVLRYLKLALAILIPHSITVIIVFRQVNASVMEFFERSQQYAPFPPVNVFVPLFHCAVAINFYIILTLFLLFLFHDPAVATILLLGYCSLEAGPLSIIFKEYAMFAGSFNFPDYYHFFTPNIVWMAVLSPFLLLLVSILYGKGTCILKPASKST